MIELPNGWLKYEQQIVNACGGQENIRQAKEKFGKLVVYTGNETINREKLDEIGKQCFQTCMECGSERDIYTRRSGWYGPVCGKCIFDSLSRGT